LLGRGRIGGLIGGWFDIDYRSGELGHLRRKRDGNGGGGAVQAQMTSYVALPGLLRAWLLPLPLFLIQHCLSLYLTRLVGIISLHGIYRIRLPSLPFQDLPARLEQLTVQTLPSHRKQVSENFTRLYLSPEHTYSQLICRLHAVQEARQCLYEQLCHTRNGHRITATKLVQLGSYCREFRHRDCETPGSLTANYSTVFWHD
jgi:hypothetical protein